MLGYVVLALLINIVAEGADNKSRPKRQVMRQYKEIPLETYLTLAMVTSLSVLAAGLSLAYVLSRKRSRQEPNMEFGGDYGCEKRRQPSRDQVERECRRARAMSQFQTKLDVIHRKLEKLTDEIESKRENEAFFADLEEGKGTCEDKNDEVGPPTVEDDCDLVHCDNSVLAENKCTCNYMRFDNVVDNNYMAALALKDIQIEIEEIRTELVDIKKKSDEKLAEEVSENLLKKVSSDTLSTKSNVALDGSDCSKFYTTEDDSSASREANLGSEHGKDILVEVESLIKLDTRIDKCQLMVEEFLDETEVTGFGLDEADRKKVFPIEAYRVMAS